MANSYAYLQSHSLLNYKNSHSTSIYSAPIGRLFYRQPSSQSIPQLMAVITFPPHPPPSSHAI